MGRLTKRELNKLKKQMTSQPDRGSTWVGLRPVSFGSVKYDKKALRRQSKNISIFGNY